MANQPTIIVISSLNQLPLDLQARLRANNVDIPASKTVPVNPSSNLINHDYSANINSNRPVIIQTDSPALRMLISTKPYNYQVGPLEYMAGKLAQLW